MLKLYTPFPIKKIWNPLCVSVWNKSLARNGHVLDKSNKSHFRTYVRAFMVEQDLSRASRCWVSPWGRIPDFEHVLRSQGSMVPWARKSKSNFFIGKGWAYFEVMLKLYLSACWSYVKVIYALPDKKIEVRSAYPFGIIPLQGMDKSWISPRIPISGLMSAPLWWNRTYSAHQDVE